MINEKKKLNLILYIFNFFNQTYFYNGKIIINININNSNDKEEQKMRINSFNENCEMRNKKKLNEIM